MVLGSVLLEHLGRDYRVFRSQKRKPTDGQQVADFWGCHVCGGATVDNCISVHGLPFLYFFTLSSHSRRRELI
jgi:hypothetical protein